MPSDAKGESKQVTRSVALAQGRTREQRIARLRKTLAERLAEPIPAVDALMTELGEGEGHPDLWEQLHAAAARDGVEALLGEAYTKCAAGPRMKRLPARAQADVLMRAADFFENVLRNQDAAEAFLVRVLDAVPTHTDGFLRLERCLEKRNDAPRLLDLYAKVAATPPRAASVLANQALTRLLPLPAKSALSETTCMQLLPLVAANPKLLDALDAHCCATKRFALACALIEQTLADAPPEAAHSRRERLVELYLGDAGAPESAIVHVEELLKADPASAKALSAADKLLSAPKVGSRAAAALRDARRARGY